MLRVSESAYRLGVDTYRIAPPLRLETHLPKSRREGLGLTGEVPVEQVVFDGSNIRYVESEFFQNPQSSEGNLAIIRHPRVLPDGGRVSAVIPAAGYFRRAALPVATNRPEPSLDELKTYGDMSLPTLSAADLHPNTKLAYNTIRFASLAEAHQITQEEKKGDVAVTVQHMSEVSALGRALPRTIVEPHTTTGIIDLQSLKPRKYNIDDLIL